MTENSFIIEDSYEGNGTSVEIVLETEGKYIDTFTLNAYEEDVLINSTIPGYLGDSYDFEIDGEFISATVKYYFDDAYLQMEDFEPCIYYYNVEEQCLDEISTSWDGVSNYVTADLEHFSTYCLLDKTTYESIYNEDIKDNVENEVSSNYNIVFALDVSPSMCPKKRDYGQIAIASFIEVLDEDDNAGFITFASTADIRFKLGSDKSEICDALEKYSYISLDSSTTIYNALNKAIGMLEEKQDKNKDIIILITDGYDEPKTTYEEHYAKIVSRAISSDISIYMIGMSDINEELLAMISTYTGGIYYKADTDEEIISKVDIIKYEKLQSYHDKNNDGIPDSLMERIFNFGMNFKTGSSIMLELYEKYSDNGTIDYESVQENDDYDEDGLENGEEWVVDEDGNIMYISDPFRADTDGDGYNDYEEVKEMKTDPNVVTVKDDKVQQLFNDGSYSATFFVNEYKTNIWLKMQIYGGNLLGNFELNYTTQFETAMLEFMQIYSECAYEESSLEKMKDWYDEYVSDVIEGAYAMEKTYIEVMNEANKYVTAVDDIWEAKDEIIDIKKQIADITSMEELMSLNTEMSDELNALCKKWDEEIYILGDAFKDKLDSKLNLSLKNVGTNRIINLSNSSQTFIKNLNTVNKISGLAMPFVEAGFKTWEIYQLYSKADVGINKYSALYHFLDTVEDTTFNDSLEDAVSNINYALSKDVSSMSSTFDYFFKNADGLIMESATAVALSQCGPIGWSIELGLSVGDLIFNTGDLNENLIYVLAYGEASIAYTYFTGDTDRVIESLDTTYYEMTSWTSELFSIYAQLRIVGEDYYAKASNSRSFLTKVVASLCGEGQDEVEEYCEQNIDDIFSLCLQVGIPVLKKYDGSYLN